jgi:hypothetical protein
VLVSFVSGTSTFPCYSTELAFQNILTVWAGIGQKCTTAITSVTITPIAEPGGIGVVYQTPNTFVVNGSFYSTQITINQGTAPVFDPINGAIISTGTVNVTSINNLTNTRADSQ